MLYKRHPARLCASGERLEIELAGGEHLKVREKDVVLLHPGPLQSLGQLIDLSGDANTAREILEADGQLHTLAELAELTFGTFTPASAWAAWRIVEDGLYFSGSPEALRPRSADEVAAELSSRRSRLAQTEAWSAFLERARLGQVNPIQDYRFLQETVDLAFGRRVESRLLREIGLSERPETAHAWLLHTGIWDNTVNPYPTRQGIVISTIEMPLPGLAPESRRDFTHLAAYAIDDQGNQDPDDALSLDGDRLWIHVADPAALVVPGSPLDQEARARGANLYLPEGIVGMLPPAAVQTLGLGLNDVSPALSFGLRLHSSAEPQEIEITPSWVRVQRLTYDHADGLLEQEPFQSMYQMALRYRERRQQNGAVEIDLPEVILRVVAGQVIIQPVLDLRSRVMVKEAMLMAGEAAARFAVEQNLPFPYTTQEPADPDYLADSLARLEGPRLASAPDLALAFALRRAQKRSQTSSQPGAHTGLGLALYGRVTSPLRRYSDLLAHQQLRSSLSAQPALDTAALLERAGESEAASSAVSQTERLSRQHWTLVFLQQHPDWRGAGVLVEKNLGKRSGRGRLILPDLAFETQIHLRNDLPLNSRLQLELSGINLAELEAHFTVFDSR